MGNLGSCSHSIDNYLCNSGSGTRVIWVALVTVRATLIVAQTILVEQEADVAIWEELGVNKFIFLFSYSYLLFFSSITPFVIQLP